MNPPIEIIQVGRIRCGIWKREGPDGEPSYRFVLSDQALRINELRWSPAFGVRDVAALKRLVAKAEAFIDRSERARDLERNPQNEIEMDI